ncbi:MAG: ABC transporter substrate-binding protein [Actinomycetes bacterium]
MRSRGRTVRAASAAAIAALALSACGGGSGSDKTAGNGQPSEAARRGGTLNYMTLQEQFADPDPQRNYSGEDEAFFGAFLYRSLTAYKLSPDPAQATQLQPDLATDTGTPSDGGRTWAFTLRDGVKWEDGKPVTCADVKYGVSRTFATDVITNGPQYAVQMLDIPTAADGSSTYKGPYATKGSNTAAFDKAVTCNQNTVTFHLNRPVPDFNYTVSLSAFSPVRKDLDTGEKYDDHPASNGPYKITEYTKGARMVLERNPNWDPASDPFRKAYPDRIQVSLGLEPTVVDQRLQADSGADQTALSPDHLEPASLSTVFNDDSFKDRRINDLDVFVTYIAINTKLVPNLKHRQAIAAALDRAQLRTIAGGTFAGDLADGVIKPNLGKDYAKSGMWDTLLGAKIPDTGDPEYAKKLIAESGEPMPALTYDYNQTPTNDKGAAALISSLGRAGIKVKPNPIEEGSYFPIVQDKNKEHHLVLAGWGSDWPNASTVIPELFTPGGGFNLSQADDKSFNAAVEKAKVEADRNKQATMWQELNRQAMTNAWVVPTRFRREQRVAGSKVKSASGKDGQPYLWAPYGTWPYPDIYVAK